jgi:hypothetical protein
MVSKMEEKPKILHRFGSYWVILTYDERFGREEVFIIESTGGDVVAHVNELTGREFYEPSENISQYLGDDWRSVLTE